MITIDWCKSALAAGCAMLAACSTVACAADDAAGFDKAVQPFFETYCLRCHDAKEQKGDFRLDTLERDFTNRKTAQRRGEAVFSRNASEMSPKKTREPPK